MNGSLIASANVKGIPLIESFSAAMKPKAGKPPVHSLLFNPGDPIGWYAGCGEDSKGLVTVARQDAMIREIKKAGANAMAVNIMNEDLSSPFAGTYDKHQYGRKLDMRKTNLYIDFIMRLKFEGILVAIVFFDGDEHSFTRTGSKFPFHRFMDRHAAVMSLAVKQFVNVADAFLLGIETNRYIRQIEVVEECIGFLQLQATRIESDGTIRRVPVGTHEQNVRKNSSGQYYLVRRVPVNADFHGYETSNHPYKGHERSADDMKREIEFLSSRSHCPIWVMEASNKKDAHARAQNHAMATVPQVIGIDGVW